MIKRNRYDHIVIGAGRAGCVVAARLVSAGRRVALIEAGQSHVGAKKIFISLTHRFSPA